MKKFQALLIPAAISLLLSGCGQDPVEAVKTSKIDRIDLTASQLLSNYSYIDKNNIKWAEEKDTDGKKIVRATVVWSDLSGIEKEAAHYQSDRLNKGIHDIEKQMNPLKQRHEDTIANAKQMYDRSIQIAKSRAEKEAIYNLYREELISSPRETRKSLEEFILDMEEKIERVKKEYANGHWNESEAGEQIAEMTDAQERTRQALEYLDREVKNAIDDSIAMRDMELGRLNKAYQQVLDQEADLKKPLEKEVNKYNGEWAKVHSMTTTFTFIPPKDKDGRSMPATTVTHIVWKDGKTADIQHVGNWESPLLLSKMSRNEPVFTCNDCDRFSEYTNLVRDPLKNHYATAQQGPRPEEKVAVQEEAKAQKASVPEGHEVPAEKARKKADVAPVVSERIKDISQYLPKAGEYLNSRRISEIAEFLPKK